MNCNGSSFVWTEGALYVSLSGLFFIPLSPYCVNPHLKKEDFSKVQCFLRFHGTWSQGNEGVPVTGASCLLGGKDITEAKSFEHPPPLKKLGECCLRTESHRKPGFISYIYAFWCKLAVNWRGALPSFSLEKVWASLSYMLGLTLDLVLSWLQGALVSKESMHRPWAEAEQIRAFCCF